MAVQVCTRTAHATDQFASACPECGHTTLVHHNRFANPSITECVICRLQATIEEAMDRMQASAKN